MTGGSIVSFLVISRGKVYFGPDEYKSDYKLYCLNAESR